MRSALALALAPLLFVAACAGSDLTQPGTGTLEITTSTSGPENDPDGYSFQIDGGAASPIGSSATVRSDLPVGSHTIQLTGVADNCTVADNPRSVTLAGGQTTAATFAVTCASTTGSVTISAATTGVSPDAGGYRITLDGTDRGPLPAGGSLTLADLPSGTHSVELSGIAPICRLEGDNPRPVTVTAGGTAQVSFTVACPGEIGGLVWRHMDTSTEYSIHDIWGTSASDLFAVGETSGGNPTSAVLRFDGQRWTEQARLPNQRIHGIWGSSPTDVFAVGFNSFAAGPGGLIYHYDGSSWTQMEDPAVSEPIYSSVWGTSGSNVWAVGEYSESSDNILISHFDGSAWTRDRFNSGGNVTDIYGTSAQDVYLSVYSQQNDGTAVLHYDGSSWSSAMSSMILGAILGGVWASSPSDVFAVGRDQDGGFIVHYDGRSWSRMEVPPVPDGLFGVWGSSSSDVYAVGEATILHYGGSRWTQVSQVGGGAVFGLSASDVYVLGNNGTVLHGTR